MPGIDGLELVRRYRADERLKDVPVIVLSAREEPQVKADSFAAGANDYVVKLPDRLELVARIRHHSRGYSALIERNEAYASLLASQRALAADLASANRYVQSLLPARLEAGPVRTDWLYRPSAALGGDSFGYHEIDDDHLAIYLLDVCGHGVDAALLSVSVLNAIRSRVLPSTDFRSPGSVLGALNDAFPMERHNEMFFTVWYGVFQHSTRRLSWSGGGHPPAVLQEPDRPLEMLESEGPLIGAVPGLEFTAAVRQIAPGARLLVLSDGVFEVPLPDGSIWGLPRFLETLATSAAAADSRLEEILAKAREVSGRTDFPDDFSLLEVRFA